MKHAHSSLSGAAAAGIPVDPRPSPAGHLRPAQSPTARLLGMRPTVDLVDALAGVHWFNSLTRAERLRWLDAAGSSVPADAWDAFKRRAGSGAEVQS